MREIEVVVRDQPPFVRVSVTTPSYGHCIGQFVRMHCKSGSHKNGIRKSCSEGVGHHSRMGTPYAEGREVFLLSIRLPSED
jgi:hypothetical protein